VQSFDQSQQRIVGGTRIAKHFYALLSRARYHVLVNFSLASIAPNKSGRFRRCMRLVRRPNSTWNVYAVTRLKFLFSCYYVIISWKSYCLLHYWLPVSHPNADVWKSISESCLQGWSLYSRPLWKILWRSVPVVKPVYFKSITWTNKQRSTGKCVFMKPLPHLSLSLFLFVYVGAVSSFKPT